MAASPLSPPRPPQLFLQASTPSVLPTAQVPLEPSGPCSHSAAPLPRGLRWAGAALDLGHQGAAWELRQRLCVVVPLSPQTQTEWGMGGGRCARGSEDRVGGPPAGGLAEPGCRTRVQGGRPSVIQAGCARVGQGEGDKGPVRAGRWAKPGPTCRLRLAQRAKSPRARCAQVPAPGHTRPICLEAGGWPLPSSICHRVSCDSESCTHEEAWSPTRPLESGD